MDTSDWEKVTVLRKKKLPPQHSTKAVNEALAKGSPVEISKRCNYVCVYRRQCGHQ